MNRYKRSWQENLTFATDIFIIAFCYILAYFIRFDGMPPAKYLNMAIKTLPLILFVRVVALIYFRLHKSIWEYASIKDLTQIIKAISISSVLTVAVIMGFRFQGFPRSIFIIDWLLLVIGLSGTRFIIRLTRPIRWQWRNGSGRRKRVLIVGAGDAGEMILREMIYRYSHNYEVVGLIDDDAGKYNRHIHGVAVLGTRLNIPDIVKKKRVQEIVIAIPSLKADRMRDIVNYCIQSGVKYRTVPNISNVVDGTVKVKQLREVRLEDLLGRDEIALSKEKVDTYIRGKVVLVTGAGGSIGSEICRQLTRLSPDKLILFEKSENALFYIDMELRQPFSRLDRAAVVGDICDRNRVREIFNIYKPQIIFHTAAYKHVPLMELNCIEAVKNNIFGTKVLAEEAIESGVQTFIMLSTDKVVEPRSVMGVTKRVAELYISAMPKENHTKFMSVRFGNVLGSEGSVVPTFKKQIERGGPITVTHPEIKRYFMTIPEATGLVIEVGSIGEGGEVFILEMGRQIKIIDLARDLIRLSGLEPDKDIKIEFTGLRPGEKIFEALIADNEMLGKTSNEKILILQTNRQDKSNISRNILELEEIVKNGDVTALLNKLKQIVPDYIPDRLTSRIPRVVVPRRKDIDILILDDEKIIQDLLRKFLEGRGFNTYLANHGREALRIIRENNVCLALVDIRIPGFMDGLKTLKKIKMIDKNIKVILITGFATEKTKRLGYHLGAYTYLEKPLDLSVVRESIEGALAGNLR
jgi:FlaA1/EpsC-like NDP-sugar epimerase/CheY-like chemotaxis protein